MSQEQRQYRRYTLRRPARLRVGTEERAVETATVNISAGGLCVRFTRLLEVDTELTVQVSIRKDTHFQLKASVRHCTAVVTASHGPNEGALYILGVEFVEVEADERATLEAALEAEAGG